MLGVTFSPTVASPRVEPTVSTPCSYTSSTATPSIFGSATYSMRSRPRNFRARSSKAAISSGVVTFCSESMGWRWRTVANSVAGEAPTRWVGESGVRSSGCASSSAWRRRKSASYSASEISGSSST